jgi:hypothetical protein
MIIVKTIARKQQKSIVCRQLMALASNSWLSAASHEFLKPARMTFR